MNPEPPPIADPYSTVPANTQRNFKAAVLTVLHLLLGFPVFVVGFASAVMFIYSRFYWVRDLQDPSHVLVCLLFSLILLFLGGVLIRHGLRIWKHGR